MGTSSAVRTFGRTIVCGGVSSLTIVARSYSPSGVRMLLMRAAFSAWRHGARGRAAGKANATRSSCRARPRPQDKCRRHPPPVSSAFKTRSGRNPGTKRNLRRLRDACRPSRRDDALSRPSRRAITDLYRRWPERPTRTAWMYRLGAVFLKAVEKGSPLRSLFGWLFLMSLHGAAILST